MNLHVDIQKACDEPVPEEEDISSWIEAALQREREQAEVSVRLVGEEEMARLNHHYRGKAGSTNVLSFPTDLPESVPHPLLGDIVVCAAVVEREAQQQHKSFHDHWAHMFIHGSLHLLGYDHIETADAQSMESLETSIMKTLGYPDPYQSGSME